MVPYSRRQKGGQTSRRLHCGNGARQDSIDEYYSPWKGEPGVIWYIVVIGGEARVWTRGAQSSEGRQGPLTSQKKGKTV